MKSKHSDEALEGALVLINTIRNELALGTQHWDKHGNLLTDLKAIIKSMIVDGSVIVKPVKERENAFKGY